MGAMMEEYGGKKGKQVFYASANKGTIKGVHPGGKKKRKRGSRRLGTLMGAK